MSKNSVTTPEMQKDFDNMMEKQFEAASEMASALQMVQTFSWMDPEGAQKEVAEIVIDHMVNMAIDAQDFAQRHPVLGKVNNALTHSEIRELVEVAAGINQSPTVLSYSEQQKCLEKIINCPKDQKISLIKELPQIDENDAFHPYMEVAKSIAAIPGRPIDKEKLSQLLKSQQVMLSLKENSEVLKEVEQNQILPHEKEQLTILKFLVDNVDKTPNVSQLLNQHLEREPIKGQLERALWFDINNRGSLNALSQDVINDVIAGHYTPDEVGRVVLADEGKRKIWGFTTSSKLPNFSRIIKEAMNDKDPVKHEITKAAINEMLDHVQELDPKGESKFYNALRQAVEFAAPDLHRERAGKQKQSVISQIDPNIKAIVDVNRKLMNEARDAMVGKKPSNLHPSVAPERKRTEQGVEGSPASPPPVAPKPKSVTQVAEATSATKTPPPVNRATKPKAPFIR